MHRDVSNGMSSQQSHEDARRWSSISSRPCHTRNLVSSYQLHHGCCVEDHGPPAQRDQENASKGQYKVLDPQEACNRKSGKIGHEADVRKSRNTRPTPKHPQKNRLERTGQAEQRKTHEPHPKENTIKQQNWLPYPPTYFPRYRFRQQVRDQCPGTVLHVAPSFCSISAVSYLQPQLTEHIGPLQMRTTFCARLAVRNIAVDCRVVWFSRAVRSIMFLRGEPLDAPATDDIWQGGVTTRTCESNWVPKGNTKGKSEASPLRFTESSTPAKQTARRKYITSPRAARNHHQEHPMRHATNPVQRERTRRDRSDCRLAPSPVSNFVRRMSSALTV
ncbi:hypothetical protein BT63DRAFT_408450 [Microthyrium microscopicum]|uniref:Uncharacterized protein n=1 Tax=Microthyrium microscopicum TaxID=703497 RepID=A0A6A6UPN1_9PEZI|nr:hypothetical protein BT63DRAFT_408450 [Microthyrium microscopicum]